MAIYGPLWTKKLPFERESSCFPLFFTLIVYMRLFSFQFDEAYAHRNNWKILVLIPSVTFSRNTQKKQSLWSRKLCIFLQNWRSNSCEMSVQETAKQCLRVCAKIVFNTDRVTLWINAKGSNCRGTDCWNSSWYMPIKRPNSFVNSKCARYFSPKDKLNWKTSWHKPIQKQIVLQTTCERGTFHRKIG